MNGATLSGLTIADLGKVALDFLLPPQCLSCGGLVHEPGSLCAPCWDKVSFLSEPCCVTCGFPFEAHEADGGGYECGGCSFQSPPYRTARSVMRYDEASRGLILGFKHADRTDAAPAFARWLNRAGAGFLAEADMIVPVPLHRWRLFSRRYNQAALLALHMGRQSGIAVSSDLLMRSRRTPSQGGLDRGGRKRNVRGAFAVRNPVTVTGKTVVLVDDVFTTGATVSECAETLLKAGAKAVDVLTLARVVT